jgi:diguanylate cyclase (GGDEF)-like protein
MSRFSFRSSATISNRISAKVTILLFAVLLLAQAGALAKVGNQPLGAVLSELIQLMLGLICLLTSVQAYRRSGNVARHYWRWLSFTFCVWIIAQLLGVYIDLTSNVSLNPLDDLLFFTSVIPFGMLIFLDPEHESNRFDRLHLLDFLQVCIFWVTVYLYFSVESSSIEWGPFHLTRDLVYNAILTTSFLLRALLTDSAVVRAFFGRMALFLLFSGLADSYAAGPNPKILPGNWFDMVWSLLLGIPLLIAATWHQDESGVSITLHRPQSIVINEFFPLLYPLFSFLVLTQLARSRTGLASSIVLLSFAGVGARMLIIQHRLLRAQQGLQFEAAHDALTRLWNHGAILDFLQREVERHGRNGESLGLMMVDLDYFKKINDSYGHMIGDLVLQEVAFRLGGSVRSYDLVGRYGGEEFLVILPGCTVGGLLTGGERLRSMVAERPVETAAGAIAVTVSIGLVSSTICQTSSSSDCLSLLRAADAALYNAKSKGRNRAEHCSLPIRVTDG